MVYLQSICYIKSNVKFKPTLNILVSILGSSATLGVDNADRSFPVVFITSAIYNRENFQEK